MQGIVNNSCYFNYLEHSRHEYLLDKGINFPELCHQQIHLVVTRIEADYKKSLKSGEEFVVETTMQLAGRVKVQFLQIIKVGEKIYLTAVVTGVALNADKKIMKNDLFMTTK